MVDWDMYKVHYRQEFHKKIKLITTKTAKCIFIAITDFLWNNAVKFLLFLNI